MSVSNFVYSRDLREQLRTTCIRRRIVGVLFPPSIFEDRCVDFRRSMIDVAIDFRRSMCRPSKIARCVDLRRSMCRLSKIDVSTFGDGCVDFRRPMIDVSTFEDRWLMCRPSKIDSRCVDLRTSIVDVQLGCYTCSKYWYYSCMRITPRVCTSVLSLLSLLFVARVCVCLFVVFCYYMHLDPEI